jgi:hypothetical protein
MSGSIVNDIVCISPVDRVATGTVFTNRCDHVDAALARTRLKDAGRGGSMSRLGFEAPTRPKSFHLRIEH